MDSLVHLKLFMYGILNNSVCLFGLSGNFLLLYIFFLYKDMRKQSINIYLTFLAVFDNGVLIFSILMLNLPAITDYQQMSTLVHVNTSSAYFTHHTTPLNFFTPMKAFPSSTSTYFTSTTSIYYPHEHTKYAFTSTRTPPDTGQRRRSSDGVASTNERMTFTTSSPEWTTELANGIFTVTPSTVLTSLPFRSSSHSSSSSYDKHSATSFASLSPVASTMTHQIRHVSTPSAPSTVHHRSKRTKRRLLRPVHHRPTSTVSTPTSPSNDFLTSQLSIILQSCFNLTSDDLIRLKDNMILLNTSSSSTAPQAVKQSTTPHDLVNQLFFEALLRQLILWVRLSLHSKLSHLSPPSPVSSVPRKTYPATKYSAVTDLLECRRSLLEYYRPEVQQNDQQSNNHTSNDNDLSPKDGSQLNLGDDEVTSINLLLLSTLEEIYQSQYPSPTDPTKAFTGEHIYADSLTGEDYYVNESRKNNVSSYEKEGEYLAPQAAGNLYPLLYYVKIVYPLALISQSGSIWTTCLITIERYLAVCHPLMSLTLSTRSRAIWALCILSLAAFLFNIPRFAEVDTTGGTIFPSELRRNKIYYHVYYICLNLSLNYILPLSLLFALNIKIYASVRHANAHRNELTRARQSELHLASMLVLIVAIFIACNAPAFLVNCMEPYFEVGTPLLEAITIFSNVLVCFNSAINFVIYCIFGKKFRSKLKQVLGLRGSNCFPRNGSSRNLRNRNYFSQRFSTASRNSSFKLTLASHLPAASRPTNGNAHTGAASQGRQYSYPHTALPPLPANSILSSGNESSEEKCEKRVRSASAGVNSIPLHNLQSNGGSRQHEHHEPNHFYEAETEAAVNTFV